MSGQIHSLPNDYVRDLQLDSLVKAVPEMLEYNMDVNLSSLASSLERNAATSLPMSFDKYLDPSWTITYESSFTSMLPDSPQSTSSEDNNSFPSPIHEDHASFFEGNKFIPFIDYFKSEDPMFNQSPEDFNTISPLNFPTCFEDQTASAIYDCHLSSPILEHNYAEMGEPKVRNDAVDENVENLKRESVYENMEMVDPSLILPIEVTKDESIVHSSHTSGILKERDTNQPSTSSCDVRRQLQESIKMKHSQKTPEKKSSKNCFLPKSNIGTIGKPEAYTKRMMAHHSKNLKNNKSKRKAGRTDDPGRRSNHNNMEKKRRIELAHKFRRLHSLIGLSESDKASKLTILTKAKNVVGDLQLEEMRLSAEKDALRRAISNALTRQQSLA